MKNFYLLSDKKKKTAIISKEINFTYETVYANIINFSNKLELSEDDKAIILSENRIEWILSLYAIWQKKGIATPIDFLSTPQEISYIVKDCKPKAAFVSKSLLQNFYEAIKDIDFEIQTIVLDDLSLELNIKYENFNYDQISVEDNRLALIIYTSGTTGNPKGVMLTFGNIKTNVTAVVEANIYIENDRIISILPFHHTFPLMGTIVAPLHSGGTIVFPAAISSEDILKTLQKYKITLLLGVPRLYKLFHQNIIKKINSNIATKTLFKLAKKINSVKFSRIIFKKAQKAFGGNIRFFISGGAKLDYEILRDFLTLGFITLEGYGLTECAPMISFNPPNSYKIGTVGKVIKGCNVRLGPDGEIIASGSNIMAGYYNKPDETSKVLINGEFYTGDLGYFDKDNHLIISGRKKELIVLPNGKNIQPEEIETEILKKFDIVKEIGLIEQNGNLLAIIYPNFELLSERGIHNISETFKWNVLDKYNLEAPPYKKILNFTIVDSELPKTRLGKLKRFELSEVVKKENKKISQQNEPSFEEYNLLKEYLQNLVKKPIMADEHFDFDIGLDSLHKVELQAQVKRMFGIHLNDKDLSVYSTLRSLSEYVKNKKTKIEKDLSNWSKVLKEEIDFLPSKNASMLLILRFITKPFLKTYIRTTVDGKQNILQHPVIFAPNHQSFFDALFIIDALNAKTLKDVFFFAKDKHLKSKFRQFFARRANVISLNINNDLLLSTQKLAALLKKGKSVAIFPEGARSRDGNLQEFKRTFAILSKELNIPVIPVAIDGAYKLLKIGSKAPKPGKVNIFFLPPIYPENKTYDDIVYETKMAIQNKLYENLSIKK